jgi:cell division protein FtsI (penicillin-binding protein 3)
MATRRPKTDKQMILRRVRWLYAIFLLVAAGVVARVVWIQYGPRGDELRRLAEEITFERFPIAAERGDILARDGRVLATTVPEYEVRMDFGVVADSFPKVADTLAGSLAELFGDRSKRSYRTMLLENFGDRKRYVRIGNRKISYTEEQRVAEFPWFRAGRYRSGYIAEGSSRRFMPMNPLARAAVGTMRDSVALGGVEASYDTLLRGTPGWTMKQKISGSFWIPVPDEGNSEPVNGMDVVTTIDADIQDVAMNVLRRQVAEYGAYWGTVMVMDVPTGEMLAMANMGRTRDGNYGEIYNYGIRQRVEPGSTFKLATLLALLEEGGMTIGSTVDCRPDAGQRGLVAMVGAARVRDDHLGGMETLREAFEKSSNIGFARSAFVKFGHDAGRFVDYVRDSLRMGVPTGIDLPQERTPDIKHPVREKKRWDATALQMMSYGYALEVTPLQTLTLYNAVANDGVMVRPRVVSEVRSYGQTVLRMAPDTVAVIASPASVRAAQQALAGVVEAGTGHAVMEGAYYTAVAKTGTAQQVREGHRGYMWPDGSLDILATFVGYFPVENPKYSCIVAIKLHEPRGKKYYGSNVAGPVFRAVADRLYARSVGLHDKVYREMAAPATAKPRAAEPDSTGVPQVVGMGLRDALFALEQAGHHVTFTGAGTVTAQHTDSTGVRLVLRGPQ